MMTPRAFLTPRCLLLGAVLALLALGLLFSHGDAAPAQAQTTLPAPTNVQVDAGNARFTVTWDTVTGAVAYIIWVTPSGGSAVGVTVDGGGDEVRTISTSTALTVTNGTTYSIQMQACRGWAASLPDDCDARSTATQVTPGSTETLAVYMDAGFAYDSFAANSRFSGVAGSEHDVTISGGYSDADGDSGGIDWTAVSAFACAWTSISTTDSAKSIKNDSTKPAECQHIRTGSAVSKMTLTQTMLDNGGVVILLAGSGLVLAEYQGVIANAVFVPVQVPLLVSNVGQATFTPTITIGSNPVAQKFTTGSAAAGYTLESLEIEFAVAVGTPANLRAELWSATSGGAPDSKLASLTVPSTVGVGAVAFDAPSNTLLDASTSYFMVVYRSGTTTGSLRTTRTNNEDTGSASGWSIGDTRHGRAGTTWATNSVELKIRVKGAEYVPTVKFNPTIVGYTETAGTRSLTLVASAAPGGSGLTVNLSYGGSTAVHNPDATKGTGTSCSAGDDYLGPATVSIGATETRKAFSITVCDDAIAEEPERFTVTVASGSGYTPHATRKTADVGITDDDIVTITRSAATLSLPETDADQSLNFGVSADTQWVGDVTLSFTAGSGSTATAGADYALGNCTLSDGATSCPITIKGDDDEEDDETIELTIALVSTLVRTQVGSTATFTITIVDDDDAAFGPPVTGLSVEPGNGSLALSWNRPMGPNHIYEVNWKTASAAHTDATTPGDPSTGWVAPVNLIQGARHTQYAICCAWTIEGLSNGTTYDVRVRPLTYADETLALWATGSGTPAAPLPPSTLTLSADPGAFPPGGSTTVTARLDRPALSLMEVRFDTEGDGGAARWGPDCDWEHGTINLIAAGQTETSRKLCAVEAPLGVVWAATLTPGGSSGTIGCFGKTDCDARLTDHGFTDNGFTVGGAAYHFTSIRDTAGVGLIVELNDTPNAALQALEFCVGATGYSIGSDADQKLTSSALGWTAGAPVSLKIAESCAASGRTMTVTAGVAGGSLTAPGIRVRALGPNPPTAITLSADPQAAANGGPVPVTARLDRPTAPGVTVRLNLVEGLGAAWWDQCDGTPPRTYPGTWGGKVIEVPPGGQEATAELCVRGSGGPRLVIGATADAPRLEARDLSLLAPAGLALRSLTVSSTDSAEGLPENSVELSDASNDYTFSVPRAVSSVTVKPAAAYETTSVKVNGSAVDETTPAVDVPLDVGDNTIRIEVRAPAVPAVREYTLTVTRMEASTDKETQVLERPECEAETGPLCGIALSAGSEAVEFSPDFAPDTTAYRATAPAGTTSVTLTPDYAEGTSVFAGSRHGATTYTRPTRVRPSGTAVELALAPDGGSTELWLMVSGSGGMTTYRIDVTGARPEPKTYSVSAASTATEGTNAALTVTLSEAAPTGGVALTVSAGYGGGSTATADDVGSIASPVTVAAGQTALEIIIPTVDDDLDEDGETFTVTISANAQGWEKAGDGRDTATVTITDDDTAGVTVTPTTLSVSEDGTATYTVSLDSRPTADVTVTVTSGDDGAAGVAPASYTFTPSGWNISQILIVSGVADEDTDNENVTVSHGAASSDGKYHGIAVASVAVTVADDTPEQQQTAEPVEIPGPVVNLQLSAKGKRVIVTWEAPQSGGAVGNYIVHLKPADGGDGKTHRPEAGKTTTTFRNLEAGATYKVWVRAQNEAGKGQRVHATVTLPEEGDNQTGQ